MTGLEYLTVRTCCETGLHPGEFLSPMVWRQAQQLVGRLIISRGDASDCMAVETAPSLRGHTRAMAQVLRRIHEKTPIW